MSVKVEEIGVYVGGEQGTGGTAVEEIGGYVGASQGLAGIAVEEIGVYVGWTPTRFPVTVTCIGSGNVTSVPVGLDCDTNPTEFLPVNEDVVITPVPDSGSRFVEYSCDASGSADPLTVTVDSAKQICAEFGGVGACSPVEQLGVLRCPGP